MYLLSIVSPVVFLLVLSSSIQNVLTVAIKNRISGGERTTIEKFPYQAHISNLNRTHCGGSIISESTILTAAHCLAIANKEHLDVRFGITDVSKEGGVRGKVAKIIVHENWNDQTIQNDIGLIILAEPLKFSDSIQPILLPEQDQEIPAGIKAFVSGWGIEEEHKSPSPVLKFAEVFTMDNDECAKNFTNLTNKMICAGRPDKGHPCSSDSGGPLAIYSQTGESLIAGIVSFGRVCSISGAPAVYTKVAAYREWIDSHIE